MAGTAENISLKKIVDALRGLETCEDARHAGDITFAFERITHVSGNEQTIKRTFLSPTSYAGAGNLIDKFTLDGQTLQMFCLELNSSDGTKCKFKLLNDPRNGVYSLHYDLKAQKTEECEVKCSYRDQCKEFYNSLTKP